jgi:LmbE family N-acetylglucosaminyl deacetylase
VSTVVLSPHFDDAVLSCGGWLAANPGTYVATVCSGRPGAGVPADPEWDALAGFSDADAAAASRRAEDREALDVLGAHQLVLGFLDGAYKSAVGRPHQDPGIALPFQAALAGSIGRLLDELTPTACVFPLGLLHPDHQVTQRAAREALACRDGIDALCYLDLPYGIAFDGLAREELDRLAPHGADAVVTAETGPIITGSKRRAVKCYRSQLPLLRTSFGDRLAESFDPGAERLVRVPR